MSSPNWNAHLTAATSLYATLDDISGVSPTDGGFHASFDHYYDNLSARQCHAKPLPCKLTADGRFANCACPVQTGLNFVLITAILNNKVYKDTVDVCGADGSACTKQPEERILPYLRRYEDCGVLNSVAKNLVEGPPETDRAVVGPRRRRRASATSRITPPLST
jgi:hypothetical protein